MMFQQLYINEIWNCSAYAYFSLSQFYFNLIKSLRFVSIIRKCLKLTDFFFKIHTVFQLKTSIYFL